MYNPSSLKNRIEVMLLMLLIAQIMMILKESMKIKRLFRRGYKIFKAARLSRNNVANNLLTGANAIGIGLFAA